MMRSIDLITNWRKCFALPIHKQFTIPFKSDFETHIAHIVEELNDELIEAITTNRRSDILDAIGDSAWVIFSLGLLMGIDVHKHFYHIDLYDKGIPPTEYDEHIVTGYIDAIDNRLLRIREIYYLLSKPNQMEIDDLRGNFWVMYDYLIKLIQYLGIDLDRVISIIYDSNMTKLCTISQAEESKETFSTKGVEIDIRLSPVWGAFEKPPVGEQPKKYYITVKGTNRIKKPNKPYFQEPQLHLY
jgi:hypothetical protein